MERNGLYKFPDNTKPLRLLFYNKDGEWEVTARKIKPITEMVIFYEDY